MLHGVRCGVHQKDYQLQELIGYIEGEWPSPKNIASYLQQFQKIKDELKYEEGLLFLNDKLIVPSSLRGKLIEMLHESHFGIEKTLARARQLFYWPGISVDIKAVVKNCQICEKYARNNCGEPLLQEANPQYPWQKVSMDIYEYKNKTYIVLIDAYSCWICSEKISNKSIDSVIKYLERMFNSYGYPTEIRTDNSPFNSKKFLQFASKFNIVVKFSSPYYAQSNGLAEKAVAIAKSIVRKAIDENKSHEIAYRLLEYNSTPIPSMGLSPCQLFMGRLIKTKLPIMEKQLIRQSVNEKEVQHKFTFKKEKQKKYYDRQKKVLSPLVVGNKVMFKKTASEWVYGVVTDIVNDRSYIIKTASNNFYRRNRRLIVKSNNGSAEGDFYDCDDYDFLDEFNSVENPIVRNIPPEIIPVNGPIEPQSPADLNITANVEPANLDRSIRSRVGRLIRPPIHFGDWL